MTYTLKWYVPQVEIEYRTTKYTYISNMIFLQSFKNHIYLVKVKMGPSSSIYNRYGNETLRNC